MIYLPPDEFWYLTVARLSVTFDDGKLGSGTGFFVYDDDQYFLVTARHVVDPTYLPSRKKRQACCSSMKFSFQSVINAGTKQARLGYQSFEFKEPDWNFAIGDTDVAVLRIPNEVLPLQKSGDIIRPASFPTSFLATNHDLSTRYAGEPVLFIGFPDNAPVKTINKSEFFYPLLRQGVFAYPPVHGIPVEGELGENYGLLDSFAQSGFSGGPVITLQKGWADGTLHPEEDYRPSKVVGLICGHYRSSQDRADGSHAGLSFFARSNTILDLISKLQ